jgi:hypothetical protein
VAHLPTSMWTVQHLRALVNYKKLSTDKWLQLKTKAQLLEKWEEIRDCGMPPPVSGSKNPASMALLSLGAGIIDADEEHEYDEIEQHVV